MTNDRPSVPHSMMRPTTGPRRAIPPQSEPEPEPAPVERTTQPHHDPLVLAIAERIANKDGSWGAEDIVALGRLLNQDAIVRTRQDDKLRVDAAVSLLGSQLDGAVTQIVKAAQDPKTVTKWKAIAALGFTTSLTMGGIMGSCMNGYQTARFEAVEPAKRAEEKAERAGDKVAEVAGELEARMADSEKRHEATETKLVHIEESVATANAVLLRISEKLDVPPPQGKKKPR